jgi:superfamily II DNA or RNA helicase
MGKIIIKNCNQCELDIPLREAQQLYREYQIRHPNAFFLMRKMRDWDGNIKFISKTGTFKIGLLPSVLKSCNDMGLEVDVVDNRKPVPVVDKPVTSIGDFKLRPEQVAAVNSVLHNKAGNANFHIGVIDYTVNAGKSAIMSALYYSFKKQLKTLLITQDADWLNQAKEEFKQYLPGEEITFVQGSKVTNWANFSIGMVQSISRNIKTYQRELSQIDMVLVDEADQAGSKTYTSVLTHLYNTRVRIGLSGTIYMSKLAKDRLKNITLESYFGPRIAEFRLVESIKRGYSTDTIVKMIYTDKYYCNFMSESTSYKDIYDDTITNNILSPKTVLDRLKFNMQYNRLPALIVCKYVNHCENIYKYLKETLDANIKIAKVHVETPAKERISIMKAFREGKVDVLVSTTIIARGKNFPLLKLLINTASMTSQEKSIQFLGRLVRKSDTKNKVYLDDIIYPGKYLFRAGQLRRRYYKSEGLKVLDIKGDVKES